eukprot:2686173-Prymnesium_polylepis.1
MEITGCVSCGMELPCVCVTGLRGRRTRTVCYGSTGTADAHRHACGRGRANDATVPRAFMCVTGRRDVCAHLPRT